MLASIDGFSEMVTWLGDLLEGNISAIDTSVYEDIEEVSSFVVAMSSSLDVSLWRSNGVLQEDVSLLLNFFEHHYFILFHFGQKQKDIDFIIEGDTHEFPWLQPKT